MNSTETDKELHIILVETIQEGDPCGGIGSLAGGRFLLEEESELCLA
jgi:hypothetical protein